MRILLLGEYSNLHWTLAQGLRKLGYDVTVASDGNSWMNNKRDINLKRSGYRLPHTIKYLYDILKNLKNLKGYDVVQIINPMFLDLKVEKNKYVYRYLRKHNKKVFLGAFGTDFFWIKACLDKKVFRYSDYYIGDKPTNFPLREMHRKEWFETPKRDLNIEIAETCDGIIGCLYEYYTSYIQDYPQKTKYISEPINVDKIKFRQREVTDSLNFFIGIQKGRSDVKGTDVLYKVLKEVHNKYPKESKIVKVESVPYSQYIKMMDSSHVMVDQLYSYTPAMNALAAMAQGLVAVSGGEPEAYALIKATNQPVINVLPDEDDIFNKLEQLILNRQQIPEMSRNSRLFVEEHHHYIKIAQQYADYWADSN